MITETENGPVVAIRTSDRLRFKRCRRWWAISSPLCANLVPKVPDVKLWVGRGVHGALALYDTKGVSPSESFAVWAEKEIQRMQEAANYGLAVETVEELVRAKELGIGMLKHYEDYYLAKRPYKVIETETPFMVPILEPLYCERTFANQFRYVAERVQVPVPIVYKGRRDGLAQDLDDGRIFLLERKTAKQIGDQYIDKLLLDEQPTSYIWALLWERPNVTIWGTLYEVLRKKVPEAPMPLVRGGFSKNKQQDTTYEIYMQTLINNYGHIPEEYAEILEHLRRYGKKYIILERVHRSRAEIANIGRQIYAEAMDMVRLACEFNEVREQLGLDEALLWSWLYPNPTRDCTWECPARAVCLMLNDNMDPTEYLEAEFQEAVEEEESAFDVDVDLS